MLIMQKTDLTELHDTKLETLTKQYNFVNSKVVRSLLESQGLTFEGISVTKARKNKGFQKHVMIFDTGKMIDSENRIRLLVTNSYNGLTSLKFNLGVYRKVCSNGLVVGESLFSEKFIHKGKTLESELMRIVALIPQKSEELVTIVKKMQATPVTQEIKSMFINKAVKQRHGENTLISLEDFKERRQEDLHTNVYNLFNSVQETIVKGLYHFKSEGKLERKARVIKGMNKDIELNKFMFDQALKLVA